jgi:hypothetical protein
LDTEQKLALFEQRIRHEGAATFPDAVFTVVERQRYRLKIRIELDKDTLIDIFYNPKNDRTDFALIRDSQRIFGYDNLGGWHRHPRENPQDHEPCEEPAISKIFVDMRVIAHSRVSQ